MHINFLYGILTDGDCSKRKTTANRTDCPKRLLNVVEALTNGMSSQDIRIAAELYIRLCGTVKDAVAKLNKVDTIATYNLADITEVGGDTIDIDRIVSNIRSCPEIEVENSDGPWDIIRSAMIYLVNELYGERYA